MNVSMEFSQFDELNHTTEVEPMWFSDDEMELANSGEYALPMPNQRRPRVWIVHFPTLRRSMDASLEVSTDNLLWGDITVEPGPGFYNCEITFVDEIRMVGGDAAPNPFTPAKICREMMAANLPYWLTRSVCQAFPYARQGFHWKEHLPATILAYFLDRRVYLYNCPETTGEYAVCSRNMRFGNDVFDLDVCARLTPDQHRASGYQWVVLQVNGTNVHLNRAIPRKPLKDAMLRHICVAHEILLIEMYTPQIPVAAYPSYIVSRLHDAWPTLVVASLDGLMDLHPMRAPWGDCGFTVTPGPDCL